MRTFVVTFTANRFSIVTTIDAKDEDDAVEVARQTLIDEAMLDVYKCGARLTDFEEL